MKNLVLIEKHLPSGFFWPNLLRDNKIEGLSVEEVVNKYQGFEGNLVSFFSIQEDKQRLKEIVDYFFELKQLSNCSLLYIISESDLMPFHLETQTYKVGYDVGVCEEEKTIYSSIFNEILFGHLDELNSFKNQLNENFLFSTKSLAEQYVCVHDELSAQGKSVEDYEKMVIYEIWKHKE